MILRSLLAEALVARSRAEASVKHDGSLDFTKTLAGENFRNYTTRIAEITERITVRSSLFKRIPDHRQTMNLPPRLDCLRGKVPRLHLLAGYQQK
jgi:hypothetical protein